MIVFFIERAKIFQKRECSVEWMDEMEQIRSLPYDPEKTIILNYPHYIEAMFYTDFTVYSYIPNTTVSQEYNADYVFISYDPESDVKFKIIELN